ncbi:unnamed protein product, partial [Mesorhabditis belari]|uniref:dolichyl-phosphate-mannose--protein mannosyltransferase n=1 Tax=Mesorhabditis belari TaxID=2138241 RepID=A0AAF3ER98_9BILA
MKAQKHKRSNNVLGASSRKGTSTPSSNPDQTKSESSFGFLFPGLLSIICCFPSIDGEFVFDDHETILNNPIVQGKIPIYEIVSRDYWGTRISSSLSHKSYRPFTTFTFWLNHQLHGNSPLGYHLVNIFLHFLVTYHIWKLTKRLTANRFTVQSTTLIFAVHPVHTEAVCNVTGRAELLMSLFFLIALQRYFADSLTFAQLVTYSSLSILSKEQGFMLPVLILFCDLLKFSRFSTKQKKFTYKIIPLISILGLLRLFINNFESPKFSKLDNLVAFIENPVMKWLSIGNLWLYNLYLLIFPISQCFDYSMGCIQPIEHLVDSRNLMILAPIPLLIYTIYKLHQVDQRLMLFGLLFGLLTFLPSSHLFLTVGFTIAERVLYLPSFAFCLLIALVAQKLNTRLRHQSLWALVALLTALSWQRSFDWRSEYSLYSSGLRVCSNNAKIHYNLGKILSQRGNSEKAEDEYEMALELNPNYEQAMNNLANIYESQGRFAEASKLLREAIRIRPNFATAWMNLGIAEMKLGNLEKSLIAFNNSLRYRPNSADCYFNLGNLYLEMKRNEEAVESWEKAIGFDESHEPSWINLLVHLDETGRCEEVARLNDRLIHLSHPSIHFQLGTCYGQLGHFVLSEKNLHKAIQLDPTNSLYYSNLGILYQRWNRLNDAKMAYQRALSLDKASVNAKENLRNVMKNRNLTG